MKPMPLTLGSAANVSGTSSRPPGRRLSSRVVIVQTEDGAAMKLPIKFNATCSARRGQLVETWLVSFADTNMTVDIYLNNSEPGPANPVSNVEVQDPPEQGEHQRCGEGTRVIPHHKVKFLEVAVARGVFKRKAD